MAPLGELPDQTPPEHSCSSSNEDLQNHASKQGVYAKSKRTQDPRTRYPAAGLAGILGGEAVSVLTRSADTTPPA